jgi:cytochrome c
MKAFMVIAAVLVVLCLAGMAVAAQPEASVEKGKALFTDPKLGTTGGTCNSCHSNGKGLEKAGSLKDLEGVINTCINKSLKGKVLGVNSVEMQSLVLYIKSLKK